ncbi:MAG: Nucleotide-binding universal stress protein, UspA family [Glomeribacter sp. 1016415]|uniref:UspA domain protein n=1 Tax=Mycoavidus cysteinexigens TaxID=1553431 RepID=A0A2Z6EUI0_9BURK|nr:universal stress protein [Mycoavidus cysteinexigens]MCX8567347.1 Nucleotide-binding universal stress protein, UspA family [Glomeribacter sp. 1016415]BBE09119.1 UspA domain protein [Mycoavidus cysteinexigens]GAM52141.1 universal stress protein UspA and related nucleotide-binding proteins [bacterium endosymbiont of Mortierella elongata FMR23-6]GLR00217.1 universal stress protein UspA [Mycoavidus cysteinexigens]
MFKHILIPTDGSELSQKAISSGIELAKALGSHITAYTCLLQYPYPLFAEASIEAPVEFRQRQEKEAHEYLRRVKEAARNAQVPCASHISAHSSPYLGIIEAAQVCGCDVILMASHGRSGLSALLIGSETQRVLTHTKVPVIVYR